MANAGGAIPPLRRPALDPIRQTSMDRRFTVYLIKRFNDGLYDECSGDIESPMGFFVLMGRNILIYDGNGGAIKRRYLSKGFAEGEFDLLNADYVSWATTR